MPIECQFDQEHGELNLLMDERFEFENCREFRVAYESAKDHDLHNITLNFTHTRYVDSSALGMMINMKRYYADQAVDIKLTNCSEQIKKILIVAHFDKQFEIL